MIVVDASVLTGALLDYAPATEALDNGLAGRAHEWLHAPDLIEPETLNALRRLAANRVVSDRRASQAARDLGAVRLLCYPHAPLRERVWELRHALTAYDASYVALAEAVDASVLLTGDKALAREAERSLGADGVRLVD